MHTEDFALDFSLELQLWIGIFESTEPGFSLETEKQEFRFLHVRLEQKKKEDKKIAERGDSWKATAENKISSKCFGEKWIHAAGNTFIRLLSICQL